MIYDKMSGFSDEISSDITEQFIGLSHLGIKYFEPRGINGKNISELSTDELFNLKKLADEYGICASSIGSPIGKIRICDNFYEHFEVYKRVVESAKILDSKYIRIFSFYPEGEKGWTNESKNTVYERLEKLVSYAKDNDVVLLHENEKDIYGDSVSRCEELMKEMYCHNFKAVFDPANFVQTGEDTKHAFKTLKPYIEYVHIKDSTSDGEIVPAGMGKGNIEFILRELFSSGYDGFLSMEPHLGAFEGLNNLELNIDTKNMEKAGIQTFTRACDAMNSILKKFREEKLV